MKKKYTLLLFMTMLLLSFAGCAGSAERKETLKRYESDREVLMTIKGSEVEDKLKTMDEFIGELESLSMATEEGERFINAYMGVLDVQVEIWEVLDAWDAQWEEAGHSTSTIDWIFEEESRLEEYGYEEKQDKQQEEAVAALRDFWSAGEEAGFDEDDYSEFWQTVLGGNPFLSY